MLQNSHARPYAKALMAEAQNTAQDLSRLANDLAALSQWYTHSEEAATYFEHPALGVAQKAQLVTQYLAPSVQPLAAKLLLILLENGRLRLLPAVSEAFQALVNAQAGIVEGQLITAQALDAATQKNLAELLRQKLSATDVRLSNVIDPAVLGGAKIVLGDRVIDATLSHRLGQLEAALVSAG
ncbi:MAG: ATP synthase F1 subunit delta, partial [Vampirovibrionales bacterium]|nr:ATP synthase F1 subunit delta [Vampirovibrionales bacterium]